MYLKQLEIHGFKSFAEKIELNFGETINAVVGPNGSGKSNIADAVRWVLGEQSVRTLRGNKMEDIIFAGSDKKKALGFAEVSLCIENSDKKIPVDYTEINIMRRIYRSGESEYYINKTQCRLKDIYELFMDTGIGRDGYSIIGQGRIDEILSNKSEDRRLVFEEAAGIVKYKTRKLEAEKKLEQTKQNIIRVRDIIEEIEGQLEPLKEQAEIAKRYRDIVHELKSIEINLLINNIDKYKSKLEAVKKESEGMESLISEKTELSAKLEINLSTLKKTLSELETDVSLLNEEIYNKMNYKEKQEGECNLIQEKISNFNHNIERLNKRDLELTSELQKAEAVVSENIAQISQLIDLYNDINEKIQQKMQGFDSKYQSLNEIEINLDSKQQQLISFINAHSELKSKISSTYTFIENIKKRIGQIEGDIEQLEDQHAKKRDAYADADALLKEQQSQSELLKTELEELKQKRIDAEEELKRTTSSLGLIKSEKDGLSSRLRVLEDMEKDHDGYSRSVKALFHESKNITPGFCGVVGEMIQVPTEYVTAIEVALGSSVQSIVTEDENDAKLLIEYLKKNKIGRATFLPITSVKPRSFNAKELELLKCKGFIGVASQLIKHETRINNIISSLLGRIAVVNDIDTAIELARKTGYEFRIVTLAGEILNAGGSMTGGSMNSSSTSVLSRKSEIETLNKLHMQKQQELSALTSGAEKLKEAIADIELNSNEKNDIYHTLQLDINNQSNKCENLKGEIQIIKDRISLGNKEIEELNSESEESLELIKMNMEKAETLNDSKITLENEIAAHQAEMKQIKEIKEVYNEEITELKMRMAATEQNKKSKIQSLEELEQRIEILKNEIKTNETEIKTEASEIGEWQIHFDEKRAEIDTYVAQIDEKRKLLEAKEQNKVKVQQEIESIDVNIRSYNKDIASVQNNLHKIEMQSAKIEVELENAELKLLETYDLSYSKAQSFRDELMNLSWASRRCDELKGEIRELGSVNVNAVEEYEKLNQRYYFLKDQVTDLMMAKDSLAGVINEIAENMKNQFITEFYKINENFNEVFIQLFGGGQAQLILSDMENVLESGIEIIAKPPGKKLQNLMLLSGGERALTAIALLFAILKMKPAPFCVLDEIDAALDDANVDRYAQFLMEFAQTTQFIIITHRKGTMEAADCLYGVSMEDSGISKLLSVKLEDKVS